LRRVRFDRPFDKIRASDNQPSLVPALRQARLPAGRLRAGVDGLGSFFSGGGERIA
jgi:hypothetical protein